MSKTRNPVNGGGTEGARMHGVRAVDDEEDSVPAVLIKTLRDQPLMSE